MNTFDIQNMPLITGNATTGIPGKTAVVTANGKEFITLWDGYKSYEYEITEGGELVADGSGGYMYNMLQDPIVETI